MLNVKKETDVYLSAFDRFEREGTDRGPGWLLPTRKAAIARFAELGFPTTRDEEWRSTNVAPITRTPFCQAGPDPPAIKMEQIGPYMFGGEGSIRLVFVNGRYAPGLSSVGPRAIGSPSGTAHSPLVGASRADAARPLRLGSMAAAIGDNPGLLEPHLARHAAYRDDAFAALNTAFIEDGVFLHVPKGMVVEEPIQLLFVSVGEERPLVSYPRVLVVAGIDSQVTVVETYAGLGGVYFTNGVTEVVAEEGAVVDHYKLLRESNDAFHIATVQLHQYRNSNVTSHVVSLGGRLVRNNINALLDGEGCECTLNGLYLPGGTQHVDNHLTVDHAKPHGRSWEFFKGMLDGNARAVFRGRIIVRPGAHKTDAKQTNMNLLLSEDAKADTRPQLEILADDVKCTHGATIGQVNEDAIFYLRSRGIAAEAARSLLIYAFARENLAKIRVDPLRRQLERLVLGRLPKGELLREAV